MSTLVAIATGFLAIIVVGTAAAWLYDLLEARWEGLTDRARRVRGTAATRAATRARRTVRPAGGHRRRAPAYAYAVETRRVAARAVPMVHGGPRDRLLRS